MDPRSEVVLRQQSFLSGNVVLINPPTDNLIEVLNTPEVNASVWCWNFADDQYFQQRQIDVTFGVDFPAHHADQVVIFIPKAKELLNYILHVVASHLKSGQSIFLVGEKKGGVERAAKQLVPYGKTLKLDSARHCQFWQCVLEQTTELKPLESFAKTYTVPVAETQILVTALPGVFSQNHLDVGTALLLPYLNQLKSGKLVDFGCGAGVLSAYLAKLDSKHEVYALDVDAFALRSTQMTLEQNGISATQYHVKAVVGIEDAPTQVDAIISNPPFHQGIRTDYTASEQLCQYAKKHLKPKGELWIVANRFLNYPLLIEQYFGRCQTVTDQQGFKVLYANASA